MLDIEKEILQADLTLSCADYYSTMTEDLKQVSFIIT